MHRIAANLNAWSRLLGCFAVLLAFAGCVPEGENSVNTRLVRPVVVSVSGEVLDAVTRAPLQGIQVFVTRRAIGADAGTEIADAGSAAGAEAGDKVVTGADGRFTITALELDVERWEYGILARDPGSPRVYRDAEAGGLYAFRDSDLELPTLLMVRVESQYRTSVQGTVKEAVRNGDAVADALVTLAIRETGEVPFSAKTDAMGGFHFDGVPARAYDLVISGSNARVKGVARAFAPIERVVQVRREDEVPAPGSGLVDLGVFFLVESAKNEDLRIVLTWDRDRPNDGVDAIDLDAYLLLPDPSCDINHLGGRKSAWPRRPTPSPRRAVSGRAPVTGPPSSGASGAILSGRWSVTIANSTSSTTPMSMTGANTLAGTRSGERPTDSPRTARGVSSRASTMTQTMATSPR